MQTRITALVLALAVLSAVGGVMWYRGWFVSYVYKAPVVPVLEVATTTETALILVSSPLPHATTSRDFQIEGKARGGWFFEGSFPVQVRDASNTVLAVTTASAQGDWMTEEYVPFLAQITLSTDAPLFTGDANLILMKDNPSGLPENEDSITIPLIIQ